MTGAAYYLMKGKHMQTLWYGASLVNLAMTVGVIIMFFAYEKEQVLYSAEQETLLLEKISSWCSRERSWPGRMPRWRKSTRS